MKKIRFDDCICKTQMVDHKRIKDSLLNLIKTDPHLESINKIDEYFSERVSKCDMDVCTDLNRSCVKELIPNLKISIEQLLFSLGYTEYSVIDIWYHQYGEGDTYGWHYHGCHYAGIYYLEFPKGCGRTEMCSPYSLKSRKIDAEEGDVIIFPAHLIHRALPNGKERKTAISFNLDLKGFVDITRIR